ncbi:unnamed protein product [Lactuca virosa]|uniref:Reverse transcriptase Ty1/copia-type domain-containing protein n=1 Tax=Lactuca virosa TaxID=75947 RepID=A0AAU9PKY6_9ASTR|nr:unnamed protein product [Lactuca virosa]
MVHESSLSSPVSATGSPPTVVVPDDSSSVTPLLGMRTQGQAGKVFPKKFHDGTIPYDPKKRAFLAAPTSYKIALTDPAWRTAMEDEFCALTKNNTWSLVPKPPDDIVIVGSSQHAVDQLLCALSTSFPIKDLGRLNYFLGIEILHNSGGIVLMQHKYATDLLNRFNMMNCKGVSTPMSVSDKLTLDYGTTLNSNDTAKYRSMVGALQYLTLTRPDISFSCQ